MERGEALLLAPVLLSAGEKQFGAAVGKPPPRETEQWIQKSIPQMTVSLQFQAFITSRWKRHLLWAQQRASSPKVFLHRYLAIQDCQTSSSRQAELSSGTYGHFQQISKTGKSSSLTCNFIWNPLEGLFSSKNKTRRPKGLMLCSFNSTKGQLCSADRLN